MSWPSRRYRVVVECKSSTDIQILHQELRPIIGWTRLPRGKLVKFLDANHRWELQITVDGRSAENDMILDVSTPCQYRELTHVIKTYIDEVLGNDTQVYYAKVVALVV